MTILTRTGSALLCIALFGCNMQEGEHVNVAGIKFEGMRWRVDCGRTTVAELDARYNRELAIIENEPSCLAGSAAEGGGYVSSVTDCAAYHSTWRGYWDARRRLAACQ